MRLLIIEDDTSNAAIIKRGLEEEEFQVDVALDGKTGLELALSSEYVVIVLDLMLPKLSGWDICRELRSRRNQASILMLTARTGIDDRVNGLELGADDYLSKPFDFNELIARVRALVRRDKVNRGRVIEIERLSIDTKTHEVTCSGIRLDLTRQEYLLLEALARYEGRTLSREFVQSTIWLAVDSYSNSVDVHIASLRRKIDTGFSTKLIRTVHREGYSLARPS